jgi:site-specific DNA-adenine methylase
MTYFAGGKKLLGAEIAEAIYNTSITIEETTNFIIKGYAENFCGMMGVYQHIPEIFKNHIPKMKFKASDRNPYIIKLWEGLKNGFNPPIKCSNAEYYKYKDTDNKSLKAIFLGFACAIRGVFRSTYFPANNIENQSIQCKDIGRKIKNVNLFTGDYTTFSKLKGYIIYCDPPYKNTQTPYSIGNNYDTNFDHKQFINWCLKMTEHNIIFVSEYTKPCKNATLIWKKGKEKLYLI